MTNQTPVLSPLERLRAGTDAVMSLDPSELGDGELAATVLSFRRELDRLDFGVRGSGGGGPSAWWRPGRRVRVDPVVVAGPGGDADG